MTSQTSPSPVAAPMPPLETNHKSLMEGFSYRRIRTRGAEINVAVAGNGPPLLLLHGNPLTHVGWHCIAPSLAKSFTVVAMDLRGYGDSSKPDGGPDHAAYSFRAMGEDGFDVMSELGFEKFALAGHDRGARTGFRMALDQPDRITHFAALDIIPTHHLLTNVTMGWGCFVLAGPNARRLLGELTDTPLDNDAFPWFGWRECDLGWASEIRVLRVNYVGELGYELHHPIAFQHHLLDQIETAGVAYGLRHVGFRALDSLRLEKSYRAVRVELTGEDTLDMAGMSRFARADKGSFTGCEAVVAERMRPVARKLVTLAIDCAGSDVEPGGNQAIHAGDKIVGRTLSGAFGHFVGTGLALAYLPPDFAAPGTALEVTILGNRYAVKVIADSPHDPDNLRPRVA